MKYNVSIIAAAVVQAMTSKPEVFGGEGSEMRSADGHVFHKSAIVYTHENGNTLVNTGMSVSFVADKVLYKDGCYRFVLDDGTKASFYSGRGVDIEITEQSDAADEGGEEEADEAPAPKKGKKAAVVEEDDEDVADEEEDFEPPVRGKKSAGKKAAIVEEEEEEEEVVPVKKKKAAVLEEEDDEEVEIPVKKKKAAVVEEEEEDEPAPKAKKVAAGKKQAIDWDDSDFDS